MNQEFKDNDKEVNRLMKKIAALIFMVMIFSVPGFAEDMVKAFTFKTIDGGTIAYSSLHNAPLVVNVGAHW